jgi:hypothetical protein
LCYTVTEVGTELYCSYILVLYCTDLIERFRAALFYLIGFILLCCVAVFHDLGILLVKSYTVFTTLLLLIR